MALVRTDIVILLYIARYTSSKLFWSVMLCYVEIVAFKRPKPPFYYDIVHPSCFAVHTLLNAVCFQKSYIVLACKLTALIAIDYTRLAVFGYCGFDCP